MVSRGRTSTTPKGVFNLRWNEVIERCFAGIWWPRQRGQHETRCSRDVESLRSTWGIEPTSGACAGVNHSRQLSICSKLLGGIPKVVCLFTFVTFTVRPSYPEVHLHRRCFHIRPPRRRRTDDRRLVLRSRRSLTRSSACMCPPPPGRRPILRSWSSVTMLHEYSQLHKAIGRAMIIRDFNPARNVSQMRTTTCFRFVHLNHNLHREVSHLNDKPPKGPH